MQIQPSLIFMNAYQVESVLKISGFEMELSLRSIFDVDFVLVSAAVFPGIKYEYRRTRAQSIKMP